MNQENQTCATGYETPRQFDDVFLAGSYISQLSLLPPMDDDMSALHRKTESKPKRR